MVRAILRGVIHAHKPRVFRVSQPEPPVVLLKIGVAETHVVADRVEVARAGDFEVPLFSRNEIPAQQQPAVRAAGEAHARAFIDSQLARSDVTAAILAEDRVREHLFGGHHALTRPRRETTERMTFEELRAWIVPRFSFSPKQIGVAEIGSTVAVALMSLVTVS